MVESEEKLSQLADARCLINLLDGFIPGVFEVPLPVEMEPRICVESLDVQNDLLERFEIGLLIFKGLFSQLFGLRVGSGTTSCSDGSALHLCLPLTRHLLSIPNSVDEAISEVISLKETVTIVLEFLRFRLR